MLGRAPPCRYRLFRLGPEGTQGRARVPHGSFGSLGFYRNAILFQQKKLENARSGILAPQLFTPPYEVESLLNTDPSDYKSALTDGRRQIEFQTKQTLMRNRNEGYILQM